jgi:hypothetical protein
VTICWGFHASAIPADSGQVIDRTNQVWERAGTRIWRSPAGAVKHEGWVLRTLGPVCCPAELTLGLPLIDRTAPRVVVDVFKRGK